MPLAPPVTNATFPSNRFPFVAIALFLPVLWAQQRFDGAALVHRAIAFGHLPERQRQVEHFAWVDFPVEDQGDQFRKIAAHGCGATEKTDVPEEQVCAIEHDAVRDADV